MQLTTKQTFQAMTFSFKPFLIFALLLPALLVGCNSEKRERRNLDKALSSQRLENEEELYNKAQNAIRVGNYLAGQEHLRQLRQRYPLGRFALQAQLETIYLHYILNEPDDLAAEADQFIELNPNNANTDYAAIMKAMSKYTGDRTLSARLFNLEQGTRDIASVRESFLELKNFVSFYTESPYLPVARSRMLLLKDMLARHEMEVGVFYTSRKNWLAAVNRSVYLLKNLKGTQYSEWALVIMGYAYNQLKKTSEAEKTMAILLESYPETTLLKKEQFTEIKSLPTNERAFTNILSLGMFSPPEELRQN